ncbi:hypothetical protein C8A05DRAFT_40800 [Staphylotrichum tortipilum]|uniref:CENP-V/GFA domain-containing protein n=1 Tax=Staphylotrichum tortipilum TaxID=2831512 RepID=A0AAN6MSK6_9PEZI|nr:hypothetical protein C8A05DRAFT_40800 [Staphylotrichum longicolle]
MTTLHARCLCRAHTFSTPPLPSSSLPLPASSCHCHSCRHMTGALRSSDASWPGPASAIALAASSAAANLAAALKRYHFSPRANILFCGTCGAPMFWEQFPAPQGDKEKEVLGKGEVPEGVYYLVMTGALAVEGGGEPGNPVVRWEDHIFVGDTKDGGAVCWLRRMNGEGGEPVKVWLGARGESEEVPVGVRWPKIEELQAYGVDVKGKQGAEGDVPIRCRCGGIDLVFRAGEAQREFEARQKKGEELPFYIDPVTHKLLASLDACDSCRISGGSEVYNWTFAALKHLSFAGAECDSLPENTTKLRAAVEAKDGTPRDPRFGKIQMFASSPDVQRYFCGGCSANLFFAVDSRPDIVDIGVGLFDSPDGARAEGVLSWSFGGDMSWMQDMRGTWREGLLDSALNEAEAFRIERGYPKMWLRVAREAAAAAEAK